MMIKHPCVFWRLVLLAGAALLSGCVGIRVTVAPPPTAPPTATMVVASPTPAVSATSQASVMPTLTPSASPVATATPSPAATATTTPVATPSSTQAAPLPAPSDTPAPTATPRAVATEAAGQPVRVLAELPTGADDLAFSPDGKLLAVGSASYGSDSPTYAVEVWDMATWGRRWAGAQVESLHEVAFSPNGARVGSASFDGTARLWDTASGALVAEKKFGHWVYGLDFSVGGGWWAAGALDGGVVIADAGSGETVMAFSNDLMAVDLALAPDGPWVAVLTSGSYGPLRVIVRDVRTFEERVLAKADTVGYPDVLAFSPDTRWLAAPLGYVGDIVIWRTGTWEEIVRLSPPAGVNRLIVSPDGRRLATLGGKIGADQRSQIVVWETAGWQQVAQLSLDDVGWDMVFSPDGRWLAVGLGQGGEHPPAYEAQLWDVATGKLVARMPHAGQVLAVAFSPDGRRIATGGHDAVKIWAAGASR